MDIDVHIQRVRIGLSDKPGVVSVENPKIHRVVSEHRAIIKARLNFFDNSFLDIHEIVDTRACYPQYSKYKYQYIKESGEQVFRYDNEPHHREIHSFPHHKHIGPDEDGNIEACQQPNHSMIFKEIQQYLS